MESSESQTLMMNMDSLCAITPYISAVRTHFWIISCGPAQNAYRASSGSTSMFEFVLVTAEFKIYIYESLIVLGGEQKKEP